MKQKEEEEEKKRCASGQRSTLSRKRRPRMQSQPLALTAARPHRPTNGKEEEVNTGEEGEEIPGKLSESSGC